MDRTFPMKFWRGIYRVMTKRKRPLSPLFSRNYESLASQPESSCWTGWWTLLAALALGLVMTSSSGVRAHDVPADVLVQILVKPEGETLRLLVRVPLFAMQDVRFPQTGPGYLDLAEADSELRDAAILWIANELQLYEDDVPLSDQELVAVRASIPSDQSFSSSDQALAPVLGPPLPDDTEIFWQQAMLDVLFEYQIRSEQSNFSVNPTLARLGLRTVTVLRFVLPNDTIRAFD